jgi:hypothetical protein
MKLTDHNAYTKYSSIYPPIMKSLDIILYSDSKMGAYSIQ